MTGVDALLKLLAHVEAVAVDCILQNALRPGCADSPPATHGRHPDPFDCTDPHVVVGALVRKIIRDENVTDREAQLAWEALHDLPLIGSSFEEVLGGAVARQARLSLRSRGAA